jgi:hypothetical protein
MMYEYERLAAITGMPRSGTSWIGQIVDSSPEVRYKMSPLFSYEFKNRIREGATRKDWEKVLRGAYRSENDFMNQTTRRRAGEYPTFAIKQTNPPLLVIKYNRFQNLTEEMLDLLPEMKLLAVVRHPCGAVHSWLTAPKEFPPDADPLVHWRSGAAKKSCYGDFFGFDDWCWVTRLHVRLAAERAEQVRLVRYETFVEDAERQTRELFDWLGLQYTEQTESFLQQSQTTSVPGDYSVFRSPLVKERWRSELQPEIRDAIFSELEGTDLARFLT